MSEDTGGGVRHARRPGPVLLDAAGVSSLAEDVLASAAQVCERGRSRYVLGIAGIGGSGKSTLAARVVAALEARQPGSVKLVAMDGFHLPNAVLEERGLRDQKGSPATFDAARFGRVLRAAREGASPLAFPVYDRQAHEPVWPAGDAGMMGASVRIVVTEGNYLLLDERPWDALGACLDACWYLDTPREQARQWLVARHVAGGRSPEAAQVWYERVDGPNAARIEATRGRALLTVTWGQEQKRTPLVG